MPNAHVKMCLFCVIKHVKCLKPSAVLFTSVSMDVVLVSMDVVFSTDDFKAPTASSHNLFQDSILYNYKKNNSYVGLGLTGLNQY